MTHSVQHRSNAKFKKRLNPWSLFYHQCTTTATTETTIATVTVTNSTTSPDPTAARWYIFS